MEKQILYGYPSKNKPWLKYYSEKAKKQTLPGSTIYEYLWENCKNNLDNIALNYLGRTILYKELFNNIHKYISAFASLNIKSGDIITMFVVNTPETVYMIYALNYLGAVVCLEYVTMSDKEAFKAVSETNSKLVIMLDLLVPKFTKTVESIQNDRLIIVSPSDSMSMVKKFIYNHKRKKIEHNGLKVGDILKLTTKEKVKKNEYIANSPAIIVHSGGTTGVPKGVVLTNDNLNAIALQYKNSGEKYNRGESFMHCIPPFHAFGFSIGIHMPLCCGFELKLCIKYDEESLTRIFKKEKPNHFVCGSSHISAIIADRKLQKMNLSFIKSIAMGGSMLSKEKEIKINKFLKEHHSKSNVLIGYGMSELAATSCTEMNNYYGKPGSVGIPLVYTNVKIIDVENGNELKYNEQGELMFNTPALMKEYFNNTSETNKAISIDDDGIRWLHSGDLGYMDEDGFVYITGRIKRIFSTKDARTKMMFKIFPDYVESVISEVNIVKKCAVDCIENDERKYIPIVYITTDMEDKKQAVEMIKAQISTVLPEYDMPYEYIFVDSIPLTPVGKVDYIAVKEQNSIKIIG